jgi:mannose PTS system EIID component
VKRALSRASVVATFVRSFLIQGSWNYRTMIGTGFGWAMLPGLRGLFRDRPEAFRDSLIRHTEHFNAHPYLSSVALGATLRLEADGADPETVQRFKTAVRGPLGGLGDSLVWATFLPAVSMAALAVYWLGLPGPAAAAFFLVLYNIGHVGLRAWGFRVGLETGREVGGRLASAHLVHWTRRLRKTSVVVLGGVMGVLLGGEGGLGDAGLAWVGLAAAGFVLGLFVGHHVWRPAAVAVVSVIAVLATWGVIR